MPPGRIFGIHACGHDAGVAVVDQGAVAEVVEFERVFGEKRYRIYPDSERFERAFTWLFEAYGLESTFDGIALLRMPRDLQNIALRKLSRFLPLRSVATFNHHHAHAAAAYFTSPFEESAILSFDSRGNDGSTVAFHARGSRIDYVKRWPLSLGKAYTALGQIIGGIHESDLEIAGKTMGLTGYGEVIPAWIDAIRNFILSYRPRRDEIARWEPAIADGQCFLAGFGPVIGRNTFGGPTESSAKNFAATFQECWSQIVLELVRKTIAMTNCRNLCVTGGGALNALTNRRILEMHEVQAIHFIPNPNDAGLAMGAALQLYFADSNPRYAGSPDPPDPYIGLPILDEADIASAARLWGAERLREPCAELAQMLAAGTLVGIVHGRSEAGPRALGNRSILCDARSTNARDVLNQEIKQREWYRPFAPVVRAEDQVIYFDIDMPVPYMSVAAKVRSEWIGRLPAVTHIDGTARIQTVTRESNAFLWQLLSEFRELTGTGVLLNTSFNVNGGPMIATLNQGLKILGNSALDAVYCHGWLFRKNAVNPLGRR